LIEGRHPSAVADFEVAAGRPGTAIAALTDLSSAHLAEFADRGDPLDLLRSVAAAERGLRLAPREPALLFDHAEALSLLGTRSLAAAAWRAALAQEDAEGWRQEARSALSSLGRSTAEEAWQRSIPELQSARLTGARLAAWVGRFPAPARSFGEEILLPRWAEQAALGRTSDAESTLRLAAAIGEALEKMRGEALLADAVVSLRETAALGGGAARRQALLRGLQEFGQGVAQYGEQNLTSARHALADAGEDLASAGNPLRFEARFYLAVAERYGNQGRALALLDQLLQEIPRNRYSALAGHIDWIAGTIDKVQDRIQSSVQRYERAAAALRRSGGHEEAAFVEVLLAESYSLLGQHALGWRHRLAAFRTVPVNEGMRRNIAMWGEAKEALLRQDSLLLAGPFVDEEVAAAARWGKPLGLATAYLDRAAFRQKGLSRQAALSDLRQAQQAISRMEDSPLRSQMAALALITEGLCAEQDDPSTAAVLLRRGLAIQRASGNQFDAIDDTTALAAAELAAGRPREAMATLEDAIALFENLRSTVENPVLRMQAFRRVQPAFDSFIRLRIQDSPADLETAFRLAERSRARVLLELRRRESVPVARREDFATLAEIERSLPTTTALVSYVALSDEILAWVVTREGSALRRLNVPRDTLLSVVAGFRREMMAMAPEPALQRAGSVLFDQLIEPLGLSPEKESLILVPDRWLCRIPFAALFDRRTGRYLIEERTLTTVPSATLLLRAAQTPPSSHRRAPASILAVGVSSPGSFAGSSLPSLPGAAREARTVASLYRKSRLLLDSEATKANFLRLSAAVDVTHFAGHAVVDLEAPGRSALLLARGPGNELQPLSLADLLEAGFGATRLVVLSACRAQDGLLDDREELLGLAGALLAAGVPEVVASPWNVDDHDLLSLMTMFHEEYLKQPAAGAAFRRAVIRLRRSLSPAVRSPAVWGGFTVLSGQMREETANGH
jgi:CHAT domain-containing protein